MSDLGKVVGPCLLGGIPGAAAGGLFGAAAGGVGAIPGAIVGGAKGCLAGVAAFVATGCGGDPSVDDTVDYPIASDSDRDPNTDAAESEDPAAATQANQYQSFSILLAGGATGGDSNYQRLMVRNISWTSDPVQGGLSFDAVATWHRDCFPQNAASATPEESRTLLSRQDETYFISGNLTRDILSFSIEDRAEACGFYLYHQDEGLNVCQAADDFSNETLVSLAPTSCEISLTLAGGIGHASVTSSGGVSETITATVSIGN
ncbi:MAG: hypothetical protein Q7S98_03620 [Deltaproteobacteria bacterium]|nr:hypothetical protein [Deltaproteobacteria bacterium]